MQALGSERFTLLDIGCSGGIDKSWLALGEHLEAYGFDPNLEEVARLNAARSLPGIEYIPTFVALEPDHPFQAESARAGLYGGSPWPRMSIGRSQKIRNRARLTNQEKTAQNLWPDTQLADASKPTYIAAFLRERKIASVDFIKLDVDGADFEILHSLAPVLASHHVLGVQLEVNFYGRADPADHTFHNTDRFMRQAGLELADLTVRRYSLAALPGRYLHTFPAESPKGRPFQGDALYVRDLGWLDKEAENLPHYSPAKLLKLAALYALRGLDDHASELLFNLRPQLTAHIDIDAALNELASAEMQRSGMANEPQTYQRYLELFEADDPRFYWRPKSLFHQAADKLYRILRGIDE